MLSNRIDDHKSEREIDAFLNRFFYSKVFKKINPIINEASQRAGIDIIADGLKIDNKAMSDVQYLNNPANSFVLELASFSKSAQQYVLGWYLNPELETTHYLFVWLHDVNVPKGQYLTSSKQINKIEVMLVNKTKIREYFQQVLSDDELKNIAKMMVTKNMDRYYNLKLSQIHASMCFCHSIHKAEGPVTLKVPKPILKKFAEKHCIVTATSITDI